MNNTTELVFILDKSGSMSGMEADTIGGFNSMIEKQKGAGGKVYVTTVLFSNFSTFVHDREDLENIKPLTDKEYFVGGATALLDAIGQAIEHIGNIHKYARKEDVPQKTLFVITTDGQENSSQNFTSDAVKEMIKAKEELGWEFLFVADNIDAVETAERMGIRADRAANYSFKEGTDALFCAMSDVISNVRKTGRVNNGWAKPINKTLKAEKNNSPIGK